MIQITYDPLDYQDRKGLKARESRIAAKADRDADVKALKKAFPRFVIIRSMLKGQLRKWAGLGIPDGRTRDIFYIECSHPDAHLDSFHDVINRRQRETKELFGEDQGKEVVA